MKLYHYIHCPFCVRVRLAFGFLKLPYETIVLPYDDEETPIKLMGKKMLPIVEFEDGTHSNESLDIIKRVDTQNILKNDLDISETENFINDLGKPIHNLCMPYWAWGKEFDQSAREYFLKKKEAKRGPFNELAKRKDEFLKELSPLLKILEERLNPFYESDTFTVKDIMVASHIWGMYVFPEFQFSEKVHNYLQNIKSLSGFNYHEDQWK